LPVASFDSHTGSSGWLSFFSFFTTMKNLLIIDINL
jgi:hypothetical protein